MKRRNRVFLMWMLTAIWLCVQSPWAQAQRLHAHPAPVEQPAAGHMAADEVPCHGAEQPSPPADTDTCCNDGHCDGHCAQLSWAAAATSMPLMTRAAVWLAPLQFVAAQSPRQPELFRPPI